MGRTDDVEGPVPARPWPLVATIALLAVVSLLNNVLAPGLYVLWACVGVLGLVLLARADGLLPRQWGAGAIDRRAGTAAVVLAAVTVAGMAVATRLPGIGLAFLDERVSGMGPGRVAFAALVRAPLGTAVLEETAFRGVLLAMVARRAGLARAVAWSSLAFGVWHVAPALGVVTANAAVAGSPLGAHPAAGATLAVLAATLAGVVLCLLRIRYDHLVVPVAVHATANAAGYLLAWAVQGA